MSDNSTFVTCFIGAVIGITIIVASVINYDMSLERMHIEAGHCWMAGTRQWVICQDVRPK